MTSVLAGLHAPCDGVEHKPEKYLGPDVTDRGGTLAMISPTHPLRRIFHELVRECFRDVMPPSRGQARGRADHEISSYVADMLTEFSSTDKLYPVVDEGGRPVRDIAALLQASDPVHGSAPSFDAERRLRKHIGDYLLFSAGMAPRHAATAESMNMMVRAGQESYWVVSQFNLFEYEREAPLFGRLSASFEPCVHGLREVFARLQRNGPRLLM